MSKSPEINCTAPSESPFPGESKALTVAAKRKVLHVIRSLNPAFGGPMAGLRMLSSAYPKFGWTNEIVTLDAPGEPWERDYPVPIHALGPAGGTYGFCPRLISWLRTHANEFQAVIVDGLWQFTSVATWLALKDSNIPYYVFSHGMLDPWVKHKYPLKHFKKWLYWPWAEYRVLRDANSVLFTTQEERRLARKSFWLYKCREAVVGYGTEAPPGNPSAQQAMFRARFPELVGKRNILFLGRIHPIKACDLIIQAFAQVAPNYPDSHLIMAGPDPVQWTEALRRMAENNGLGKRITWVGPVSGDLKWGAIRCADAFIHPSHQENFGVAIAEALACSVPVLISDKVNIQREVVESNAGFVAEDSIQGVQSLLNRWLSAPELSRSGMRQAARNCFSENFDIMIATARLTSLMESAVDRGMNSRRKNMGDSTT